MCRKIEGQPNGLTFKQLKQGIDHQTVLAKKVDNLGEYRFADKHRGPYLFHQGDGPLVMRIVAIEIGKEGACVAYRNHGRRNLARAFVADNRWPAKLPARSAVTT